jgi:hypothetical protein
LTIRFALGFAGTPFTAGSASSDISIGKIVRRSFGDVMMDGLLSRS